MLQHHWHNTFSQSKKNIWLFTKCYSGILWLDGDITIVEKTWWQIWTSNTHGKSITGASWNSHISLSLKVKYLTKFLNLNWINLDILLIYLWNWLYIYKLHVSIILTNSSTTGRSWGYASVLHDILGCCTKPKTYLIYYYMLDWQITVVPYAAISYCKSRKTISIRPENWSKIVLGYIQF